MAKKCPHCNKILPDDATSCVCGAKFPAQLMQLPYQGGQLPQGGYQSYQGGQLHQGGYSPYQGSQPYQGGYPPYQGNQPYQGGYQSYQGGQLPQGGYPPYQGGQPYQGGAGLAVGSMVLGILSLVSSCFGFSVILAIISLALGGTSLKGNRQGRGMATAGVVCSVFTLVVFFMLVIIGVSFMSLQ